MAEIRGLLEPQVPSLYRYALALTRDASRAEDLVQTCIVRALANQDRGRGYQSAGLAVHDPS